jgi:hypothetical protein
LTCGVAPLWGWSLGASLVLGLALSVASTVVLLRALEAQGILESVSGRIEPNPGESGLGFQQQVVNYGTRSIIYRLLSQPHVGGHRDGFNVFEVLVTSALTPGQELLDSPIISGSCVRVANRDRKKLEEFLAGS